MATSDLQESVRQVRTIDRNSNKGSLECGAGQMLVSRTAYISTDDHVVLTWCNHAVWGVKDHGKTHSFRNLS